MTARIRVLVVEDSATVREHLCAVLQADPAFVVIGRAEDGRRAIELCRDLRPDVVTLDMMLPVMSGLAATEYIMAYCPTPILIVSSSTNRGELFRTYDALAAGAVDVLEKPRADDPPGAWEGRFIAVLKLVARIKVITHPRARLGLGDGQGRGRGYGPGEPGLRGGGAGKEPREGCRVVAVGASTGGPGALVTLLRGIPADFAPPLLIVLHIGEAFGAAFAEWLDSQTRRRVAYAREGDPIAAHAGRVALAPPGRHLVARGERLHLTSEAERHSCRPSVDVLFESVAAACGPLAIGCLLTGMGRDGGAGLLAMRLSGARTIAQDEESSVVWGMPREAVILGAAERVLPLAEIGPAVGALAR